MIPEVKAGDEERRNSQARSSLSPWSPDGKCSLEFHGEHAFVLSVPALPRLRALQHPPAAPRPRAAAFASRSVSSGYFIFIKSQ